MGSDEPLIEGVPAHSAALRAIQASLIVDVTVGSFVQGQVLLVAGRSFFVFGLRRYRMRALHFQYRKLLCRRIYSNGTAEIVKVISLVSVYRRRKLQ